MRSTKKKSPGPDGVPHWILQRYASLLSPAVTRLFNQSFEDGRVPACFKEAIITPVPKKPRPSCPGDYRPISLLPLLSKIAEKIVATHWIKPYIRGRLQADQFAYIPGPGTGTSTALTLLYHKVLQFLDGESGAVRLLSIDFSRAFDKLPHSAIQQAIMSFNFPGEAVAWISDFLTNRRQRTRADGILSSWAKVTSGVPQGSVIGPLLFCTVLDSLSPLHDNTRMIKYADDVTILHFVRETGDESLQSEWDHVTSWSSRIGLPVNAAKCAVMDYVTKSGLTLPPVRVSAFRLISSIARCHPVLRYALARACRSCDNEGNKAPFCAPLHAQSYLSISYDLASLRRLHSAPPVVLLLHLLQHAGLPVEEAVPIGEEGLPAHRRHLKQDFSRVCCHILREIVLSCGRDS